MDKEIDDIKRRAGINEEQENFSMEAYEQYLNLLDSEYQFLGNLAQVISRTMAPNNSRQVLSVIGNRREEMERLSRDVNQKASEQRKQLAATQQTDAERM